MQYHESLVELVQNASRPEEGKTRLKTKGKAGKEKRGGLLAFARENKISSLSK